MDKRKRLVSIIAGFLVVAMILGFVVSIVPIFASAEGQKSSSQLSSEIGSLKDKKSEIDDQIKKLEGQISENKSETKDVIARKDIIEQEIFLLHEKINNINEQISSYGVLISEKQKELVDAQARLDELNVKNKERIRAMEENGKVSYWSVLFQANSFSDLLDRLNMIEEIAASDRRRLDEMSKAAEAVETAKQELETEKAALESTRAELNAAQEEMDAKRAEADALLSQLLATGAEYQALLYDAEAKTEEMMQELSSLEAEYKKAKDREYQQWLESQKPVTPPAPPATPKPPTGGGGGSAGSQHTVDGIQWLTPINFTRVSSPFGYRMHPIYHEWRLHAGVDLSAPQGTPIIASRSGVVTTASYEAGGAGYYVNINHMDGFVTRYMHMTHFIVSPGQNVSAGQVIGYCGATGAATGPHLHFSVYYNGTPVNPAQYINI